MQPFAKNDFFLLNFLFDGKVSWKLVVKLNYKWGLFSLILCHDAAFCPKWVFFVPFSFQWKSFMEIAIFSSGDPEQEEAAGHSEHRLDSSSRLVTADTEEIFLYHRQKIFNHRKIFIAGVSGVRMVIAMMGWCVNRRHSSHSAGSGGPLMGKLL